MKVASIYTKEIALLESMTAGSDRETKKYLRNMHENFVVPYVAYLNGINRRINEAELTPDQITQLFGTVSQQSQAAGGNETMLGKMLPDAIKKKFVDSLPAPDAGEVPGFEEKATAAAAEVTDPATKQSLMQLIKTGLQNPVTQKLIIAGVQGVVGVTAGALTGGMGGKLGATAAGAITGGLVGLIAAKLQGQDWKSAAKAGLKGAAVGGAGGLIGSTAASMAGTAADAIQGNNAAQNQPAPGASLSVGQELPNGEVISALNSSDPNAGVTVTKPDGSSYSVSRDTAQSMTGQQGISPQSTGPVSQGTAGDSTTAIGKNFDAGIAPIGPNGQPMRQVPLDVPPETIEQPTIKVRGQPVDVPPETIEQPTIKVRGQPVDAPGGMSGVGALDPSIAPIGPNGQPMRQVPMDEPSTAIGKNFDAGIAPIGPNGQPMRQVPMDEPTTTIGKNFDAGIAPIGPNGQPMRQVPMDEPSAATDTQSQQSQSSEIATDGKPYPEGLSAEQKQIYDNPITVSDSGNTGTVKFTDGSTMQAVFVDPNGPQPRLPGGAQVMEFPFNGKMVPGRIIGNKVWFLNWPGTAKSESKIYSATKLKEYINKDTTILMWALHERVGKPRGGVHLTEAGIGDLVKNVGSWLKTKGQNLTQKITADKLMQAWTKAGKPTDSEKIAELLQQQGVDQGVVSGVYQSMGIPSTSTPATDPSTSTPTTDPAATSAAAPKASPRRLRPNVSLPGQRQKTATASPAADTTSPAADTTSPAADTTSSAETPAATADTTSAEPAAEPAAAAPAPVAGGSIFADPKKLRASFESYLEADGTIAPQFRGVLKDILLTALRTVESKQRKMNKIIKEAKKIKGQLSAIKKQY